MDEKISVGVMFSKNAKEIWDTDCKGDMGH